MAEVTPTHSVLLELREERQGMEEGYHFLDEKRLVLAARIMRELARYETEKKNFEQLRKKAAESLKAAVIRHGLEGLLVYPVIGKNRESLLLKEHFILGVTLHDVSFETKKKSAQETLDKIVPAACNPSPEAEYCRTLFSQLVIDAAFLAGITRNLQRLHQEYQKTAKRARALEDILLPEMDSSLTEIETALEDLDREEAIRVRYSFRH